MMRRLAVRTLPDELRLVHLTGLPYTARA
jgi:hypothetical protein